jgi:uncharacterized OB-fold protein
MSQTTPFLSRPRPVATSYSQFFWDGARRGQLLIQCCGACNRYAHPPGPICPSCGSREMGPVAVSGRGTLHSFCLIHHVFHPAFKDLTPYLVARVELDEQPELFLIANLRNCPREAARVGLPVRVLFETVGDDVLPQFEPAPTREGDAR